jgi:signal transduction histidine kinase
MWQTVTQGKIFKAEVCNRAKDGTLFWVDTTVVPFLDETGKPFQYIVIRFDLTERKRADAALAKAHQELVEVSRQAGMAEVATGVLHNVGNVLNSINVTATCVAESLRKSKAASLPRLAALLREQSDLGAFLTTDPRGQQVPEYLTQLSEHIVGEQAHAQEELTELRKHIDHIKDIVTMQQGFARVAGLTEIVNVPDLVEDALRMNVSSLLRHDVKVIKEFSPVPPITVEKHKVLQIIVNLLGNAKHACEAANRDDKQVTLRVMQAADRVRIEVADNGVGIAPENLTRIFSHGFTTKKTGHGFGLHSGALAARELGGALKVHSAGVGQGATFTVELPLQPQEKAHA